MDENEYIEHVFGEDDSNSENSVDNAKFEMIGQKIDELLSKAEKNNEEKSLKDAITKAVEEFVSYKNNEIDSLKKSYEKELETFNEGFIKISESFNEMNLHASKLTYAIKILCSDQNFSSEEKKEIMKEMDEAQSIKEAKDIYERIIKK
ncbi:MAG: hypothetical protein AABY15_03265 [Nanoarchaeota archaeon]|mgnify:CR=1 FL=1